MIHQLFPKDIRNLSNTESSVFYADQGIQYIEFDSRDVNNTPQTLFVCVVGQKVDGHDYIDELIEIGIRNFLISNESYKSDKANFYLCKDTVSAFQKIAQGIREKFKHPVIAITGSNGKTIIKEWLGQLMSMKYTVCKSPKSYNSQLGVPYSVSKLTTQDFAIFEAGISQANEMTNLQKIIQPNIGIFTNIGDAHSEGFDSRGKKIEEKLELFQNSEKIIYCSDQLEIDEIIKNRFDADKLVSWGRKGRYRVTVNVGSEHSFIYVNEEKFKVNFVDEASIENSCHCIVSALEVGMLPQNIRYGLELLSQVEMRLEIKEGANNNLLLNDSYNNDLAGLKMTLDLAKKLEASKDKVLIVSDFLNQKENNGSFKKELEQIIDQSQVREIIWVGKSNNGLTLSMPLKQFDDARAVVEYLETKNYRDQFFILKGARQYQFEQIADVLEQKQHRTRIEVNLSQLIQNLGYYKSLLKPRTKVMAMVKAFAYGTGIIEVSKLLEMNQIDYLTVAYTDEGVFLRENGIKTPIMVMNVTKDDLDNLLNFDLEPEVYSLSQFEYFVNKSDKLKYHLKLDTGMHRLGFEEKNLNDLLTFIDSNKQIKIESVFTHLASAGREGDDKFTNSQFSKFEKMAEKIETVYKSDLIKHVLNSSGIERFTEYQFDMVRLGIGLYGFGTSNDAKTKQVLSLKTNISQIKELDASESVGYNRTGTSTKDFRIATIPVGYADGYDRRFSNGKGAMLINGLLAPVIGNVCMDMTMVDVTEISCREGDEVIVYGKDINIEIQAKKIGTISYELLTHLSERVRRIFYFE